MSVITGTYLYTFDTLVLVKVKSTNSYGDSDWAYNIGNARVESAPSQMSAPTVSAYSDTQITVTWSAVSGTAAGNSAVTSYTLYWNKGTDAGATT